jgi:hypothetical protein
VTTPAIADRQYTIEYYLSRSGRATLPLDRKFVQRRVDNNRPQPGPLHHFVQRARESALEQYLFLHALASSDTEGEFDARLPAATWARAVGGYFDPQTGVVEPAALHAVSRNWRFLKELNLVDRARVARRARVWILADDGSGDPYEHPGEGSVGKKIEGGPGYIQLPFAYWYERWHERLSLPGKAVLLVGMTLGDGFSIPYAKFPEWYGFSASTGERGLAELLEAGLLHRELHRRPDPESPVGFADAYYYELLPPFGPRGFPSKSVHSGWIGPPRKEKKPSTRKRKVRVGQKQPAKRSTRSSTKRKGRRAQ